MRKLGIDPTARSRSSTRDGHVHLYTNPGNGQGATTFKAGWAGGTDPHDRLAARCGTTSTTSKKYDIVMLSCEGEPGPGDASRRPRCRRCTTTPTSAAACSCRTGTTSGSAASRRNPNHGLADWEAVATFNFGGNPSPDTLTATIDETSNPKGMSFATWMINVGGSTTRDLLPVDARRATRATSVDTDEGRAVGLPRPAVDPAGHVTSAMNFQFTTPQRTCPRISAAARSCSPTCTCRPDSTSAPGTAYPERLLDQPADPAGEGAGVHVLRHRVVRRSGLLR